MLETGFDEIDELEDAVVKDDDIKLDSGYGQTELGADPEKNVSVDVVICIDITGSMSRSIENVKKLSTSFFDDLKGQLKKERRNMKRLRVKVIGFRDFYCDGEYSLEETEFFELPKEATLLENAVSKFEAAGGGDAPESSLEALALAMKSDWIKVDETKERARHIIVMFTDAPAHRLEMAKIKNLPENYPKDMLGSYDELYAAWFGQAGLGSNAVKYQMNQRAKRLVLFTPKDIPNDIIEGYKKMNGGMEPFSWEEILEDFNQVYGQRIEFDKGGNELNPEVITVNVAGSVSQ